MKEISELAILFEAMKLMRLVRIDGGCGTLSNGVLYRIAKLKPRRVEELSEISSLDDVSAAEKSEIVSLVNIFTRDNKADCLNAPARLKLEQVELCFHRFLVQRLHAKYGQRWWYSGVPEKIRVRAAQLHEESEGEITKEAALYFRDLKEIACQMWGEIKDDLGCPQKSRRTFGSEIDELMELRNRLSHPVRLKDNAVTGAEHELLENWLSVFSGLAGSEAD